MLGPTRFRNLATDYVLACPSEQPDLRFFGDRLPGWLEDHPQANCPHLDAIARIEVAIAHAIHAADCAPIDASALTTIPLAQWPSLRFRAVDGVALFDTPYDFAALWAAQSRREAVSTPPENPTYTLVWRQGHQARHERIEREEGRALGAMLEGASFTDMCDTGAGHMALEGAAPLAARWLHQWLARGHVAEAIIGVG